MKLILILLLTLGSCQSRSGLNATYAPVHIDTVYKTDTIYKRDTIKIPSKIWVDTVFVYVSDPALKKRIDSLNNNLFVANYKLARVKYYLNICLRNSSQDKFLKGWIKRVL